jgi:hypothetical protein
VGPLEAALRGRRGKAVVAHRLPFAGAGGSRIVARCAMYFTNTLQTPERRGVTH